MMLVQLLGGGGMRRLRRVDNSTSRTTKQARENLPSVELNSHYI